MSEMRRKILIAAFLAFVYFLGFQISNPHIPRFLSYIGASETQIGLLVGLFAIMSVSTRIVIGRLSDLYGRRAFILGGYLLAFASLFLYPSFESLLPIAILRILHGLAHAMFTVCAMALIADLAVGWSVNEAMSYYGIFVMSATTLAPTIGGFLYDRAGFPWMFRVAALSNLIGILILISMIEEPRNRISRSAGAVLRERSVLGGMIGLLSYTITYGAVVGFLSVYMGSLGFSNVAVGYFFSAFAFSSTLGRFGVLFLGEIVDRIRLIIPSLILVSLSVASLSIARSLPAFLAIAAIYGASSGIAFVSLSADVAEASGGRGSGVAMGGFMTSFDLGVAIGSTLFGPVAEALGYPATFLASSILSIVLAISYLLVRIKRS